MSNRKLSGRLNVNSPTPTSTEPDNATSVTLSQSPMKSSPTSSPSSMSVKSSSAVENSNQSATKDSCSADQSEVKKRLRRGSILSSPLASPLKKMEEHDESLLSVSDNVDDEKSVKSLNEDEVKDEKGSKEKDVSVDSPVRSRKRRLYESKPSMVTRKSTMDNTRNTRSLRCIRRDSQGKLEGFFEICPTKRGKRKRSTLTPELSTPTKKKKEEDSELSLQKKLKTERLQSEDENDKIEDEEYIKEEDKTVKQEKLDISVQEISVEEEEYQEEDEEGTNNRPQRVKKKIVEEKPKPAKRGRKPRPKPPVEVKMSPKQSITKKSPKLGRPRKIIIEKKEVKTESLKAVEVDKPLSVDTNAVEGASEKEASGSTSVETSEKAASLSPDLVSEGVNVEIVKDFYKKPEFLENNRGIEKDPKLGEIVQEVEKDVVDEKEKCEGQKEEQASSEPNTDAVQNDDSIQLNDTKSVESEKEKIDQENVEKEEIPKAKTNDDSHTDDLDLSSPNLNTGSDRKTPLIEKEEAEMCGSRDSSKDNDIVLFFEGSSEDISNNIEDSSCVKDELEDKMEKQETSKENEVTEVKVLEENESVTDDTLIKPQLTSASVKEEVGVNLNLICDKISSSDKNSNGYSFNSNKAVDNKVLSGDKAIKDIKDGVKEENCVNENAKEDVNSQKEEAEESVIDEQKNEDDAEEHQQQMEVDSGISDAVTEPSEDVNILETSCEKPNEKQMKNLKCDETIEEIIDVENVSESDDIDLSTSVKNVEEESDSEKVEKAELELLTSEQETVETLQQKENHLKSLGLLTHKAAVEAKIEKQKRRKQLQSSNLITSLTTKKNGSSSSSSASSTSSNGSDNGRNGNSGGSGSNSVTLIGGASNGNKNSEEYTGTLKTVIKLNRQASTTSNSNEIRRKLSGSGSGNEKSCNNNSNGISKNGSGTSSGSTNEGRQPLKMTFQKGRGRPPNSQKDAKDSTNSGEETYYTIQNESEGLQQHSISHGRKFYNRSHAGDVNQVLEAQEPVSDKIEEKELVLIPEKASSFSIHPGRLCQDQCFYCGGRFGLYDTPCHVAQLKSDERKQKILTNEEKLTIDNCLCDACFRHVVRRAKDGNCKPRMSASSVLEISTASSAQNSSCEVTQEEISVVDEPQPTYWSNMSKMECFIPDCKNKSSHTLRRKCIRKTIKKLLPNFDMSRIGGTAPICEKHYNIILQFLGCALCKRRLGKNHMQYINQDSEKLGKLLAEQGIPVKLASNSAVCKLCKYFVNLVLKPPDHGKLQKEQFVKNYRRRLLHFHNIQSDETSDTEDHPEVKAEAIKNLKPLEEKAAIAKGKRGRKPKNQTATAAPQSSESVGAGPNTPPSSDEGNEKQSSSLANTMSGQIMLDNDVMVDYDMPLPLNTPSPPENVLPLPSPQLPPQSPPPQIPSTSGISVSSKLQTILQSGGSSPKDDISIVLRSNPNISMRELFPGEEEMGLHINVPFGSSQSYRTPEGWTRIQTFLQYDEQTRRLWENLQKPYGNQSSFLRHLILLEKYFRNGDLILSHNASDNATVYSETVRNRLRSFDNSYDLNGHGNNDNNEMDYSKSSIKSFFDRIPKHVSNLPITITTKQKESQNSSNNSTNDSSNKKSMLPVAGDSILKSNLLGKKSNSTDVQAISNDNSGNDNGVSNAGMTKQQKLLAAASRLIENGEGSSPDPINSHSSEPKKSMPSNGMNLPPQLISIFRGQNQNSINPLLDRIKPDQMRRHKNPKQNSPNVVILPDTLTPRERIQSKNWRPTLMPVSQASQLRQPKGPIYQTADGRRLPGLVQVQSGGHPYLISIHDYNRMCILRREKIIKEQLMKNKSILDQHNLMQQEKSLFMGKFSEPSTSGLGGLMNNRNSQQHLKSPPQQTSLLKNSLSTSLMSMPPKMAGSSSDFHISPQMPSTSQQQQQQHLNSSPPCNSISITPSSSSTPLMSQPTALNNSTAWLWGNMKGLNTNKSMVSFDSAFPPPPTLISLSKQQQQQQQQQQHHQQQNHSLMLDNSLLSKIPKSLTVIPQQKLQRHPSLNSMDDLTSA